MKKPRVRYIFGQGWHYYLGDKARGPFPDAKTAGLAMRRELFYLRALQRAKDRREMTYHDKLAEAIL